MSVLGGGKFGTTGAGGLAVVADWLDADFAATLCQILNPAKLLILTAIFLVRGTILGLAIA